MSSGDATSRLQGLGAKVEMIDTVTAEAVSGPDRGARAASVDGRVVVGRGDDATFRLTDRAVSLYHLELACEGGAVAARDLGSSNGTWFHGASVKEVRFGGRAEFTVGSTLLRVTPGPPEARVTSSASRYHELIGASSAMRTVYLRLEQAAATSSTVLLLGESGTGKELAARSLHAASARAARAFEVVHCGGLPTELIESELFGHARGAFTGAWRDREGAFERASEGTIFLDEVGELPLESQPKLLRVLETGDYRRVGDERLRRADVRVVAATHRDLRSMVNEGRFRADLYYRLAVLQVRMPALRERLDDLPLLASALMARIARDRQAPSPLAVDEALLGDLRAWPWPGNVRELRNHLEQWMVMRERPPRESPPEAAAGALDPALLAGTLRDAKDHVERAYLTAMLERSRWNVAEAARHAGIDRVTFFRLLRRHQIERPA